MKNFQLIIRYVKAEDIKVINMKKEPNLFNNVNL